MSPKEALPAIPVELPVLALRDTVVFPQATAPLTVGRAASRHLLATLPEDKKVLLAVQRDPQKEEPGLTDLFPVGVIAVILKSVEADDQEGHLVALARGLQRARILDETQRRPH